MKKLILAFLVVISLSFFIGCKDNRIGSVNNPILVKHQDGKPTSDVKNNTGCDTLKVGNRYTLYGYLYDKDDPFDEQPISHVVIVEIKMGYVRYVLESEYNDKKPFYFSRSCEAFINLTNNKRK